MGFKLRPDRQSIHSVIHFLIITFFQDLCVCFLLKTKQKLTVTKYKCKSLSITEPNDESAANVDAAKMWRDERSRFEEIAEKHVKKSLGLCQC